MIKKLLRPHYHRLLLFGRRNGLIRESRFVLLCHQRSGSNMLTSIFNQHPQIVMRGQLYKDDPDYQREIQSLGTVPFTGHFFDDQVESRLRFDYLQDHPEEREPRNAKIVAETFYRGQGNRTPVRQIGIKFHGGTLYRDEIEEIFFSETDYTIMLLRRDNLLAAGISWYQARTLNQWVSRSPDQVEKPKLHVDLEMLRGFIYRTRDDIEEWKELLTRHKKPYLELTYEQITAPGFSYDIIWNHLRVKPIPTPAPKTYKLIKDYSHIENLEEIRAAFAGKGLGQI